MLKQTQPNIAEQQEIQFLLFGYILAYNHGQANIKTRPRKLWLKLTSSEHNLKIGDKVYQKPRPTYKS